MNKNFIKDIKDYDIDDLQLIYDTQKELYTSEEMQVIKSRIEELKSKQKQFPKKIKCHKCDQFNPFENDICMFCQCKLDKRKYYREDYIYDPDEDEDVDNNLEILEDNYIPRCPTCNSPDICKISIGSKIVGFGVAGIFSSNFGKTMICNNCGYK